MFINLIPLSFKVKRDPEANLLVVKKERRLQKLKLRKRTGVP